MVPTHKEVNMSLIQTIDPEKAEGDVKEIYDALNANIGMIPSPMELSSASPWMIRTGPWWRL
jgi:hypothetical protein